MKHINSIIILFLLSISINSYSNEATYGKYCKTCHGDGINNVKISFFELSKDYTKYELINYLKYKKNKYSVHSLIMNDNKTKQKLSNVLNLSYNEREEIANYILMNYDHSQCAW